MFKFDQLPLTTLEATALCNLFAEEIAIRTTVTAAHEMLFACRTME